LAKNQRKGRRKSRKGGKSWPKIHENSAESQGKGAKVGQKMHADPTRLRLGVNRRRGVDKIINSCVEIFSAGNFRLEHVLGGVDLTRKIQFGFYFLASLVAVFLFFYFFGDFSAD
jgi:hypothetical protein